MTEYDLVYPVPDKADVLMNEKDLAAFVDRCIRDDYKGKNQTIRGLQVLHAAIKLDATTGRSSVHVRAKMQVFGATEADVAKVEAQIPVLIKELSALATMLFKGSRFLEPFTPVVTDMISVFVRARAVGFYCGPDTGDRPGKGVVLAVFEAVDQYYREVEVATKEKSASEDVLSYMLKTRKRPAVDQLEIVTRLLADANIPLSPTHAVGLIETWLCNPVVFARALDRLLQSPKKPVELTAEEKINKEGAAEHGAVDVETVQDELGAAIASTLQSVANTGGVGTTMKVLGSLVLFFGGEGFVGRKLDESLDPTITVHIENVQTLQKLLGGPQSPGMDNDESCVGHFYGHVLGGMIEKRLPSVVQSSAKSALTAVAIVPSRADMLKDLVFNFVLPRVCVALESVNAGVTDTK
jgi:hypothetical protein